MTSGRARFDRPATDANVRRTSRVNQPPATCDPGFPDAIGLTIWSFRVRWWQRRSAPEAGFPPWNSPLDVVDHCAELGCPSLQTGVDGWDMSLARAVRQRCERLGIALEGQIELPGDLERFERDLMAGKEAGATIFRCYCLLQRRYEHFSSRAGWERWREESLATLREVEPILAKHRVRLAVENHKDWTAAEQAEVFRHLASEWIGVCLDFGNSLALLEEPVEVARTLSPWILTTHIKDMGLGAMPSGFLLSEVPLGQGILDLAEMFRICQEANPRVRFLLEMITRDPLPVPCFSEAYGATFAPDHRDARGHRPGEWIARSQARGMELPCESPLDDAAALALEERLVAESLSYLNPEKTKNKKP